METSVYARQCVVGSHRVACELLLPTQLTDRELAEAKQAAERELAEADRLWTGGVEGPAVAIYRAVLLNAREAPILDRDELARLYGRIIDFEIEGGDLETAKELLAEAVHNRLAPSVSRPEARALIAEMEAEPNTRLGRGGADAEPPRARRADVGEEGHPPVGDEVRRRQRAP